MLQVRLADSLKAYADRLHIIDGLPIPVCKFARAYFSRVFKGEAAYGYCATKKERYYGFRGHLVIGSIGVVTTATFTPANIDEYIRPELKKQLQEQRLYLQTLLRENMEEKRPKRFLNWLKSTRRLIETSDRTADRQISY